MARKEGGREGKGGEREWGEEIEVDWGGDGGRGREGKREKMFSF